MNLEKYFNDFLDNHFGHYGILKRIRLINHIAIFVFITGCFLCIISTIGIYYSIDVVYSLSSAEKSYNETVGKFNPELVVKPHHNIFTNDYVIGNYLLFIPSLVILIISSFAVYFDKYFYRFNKSFICAHCKMRILLTDIHDYTCPICKRDELNYNDFINGCGYCGETMKKYSCPHCEKVIDLELPYNENKLIRSRYDRR